MQRFVFLGGLLGFAAVAAGAFGAHALRARLTEPMLAIFETGARYHLVHAVVLVVVGLLQLKASHIALTVSGWAFTLGVLVFSGSLYALALSSVRWLGAITPLGGVALLVGWGALAAYGAFAVRAP